MIPSILKCPTAAAVRDPAKPEPAVIDGPIHRHKNTLPSRKEMQWKSK